LQNSDFFSGLSGSICPIERGRRPLPIEATCRTRIDVEGAIMASHPVTAKDINALAGRDYPEAERAADFLRGLFARLEARIGYWRRYRATVAELDRLTDAQLADIGIMRGNIHAVARAAARA
jgi:uncharacterized protein YjiS (DUF1127 family)